MATASWNSPVSSASDAAFQAWASELYQYLTATGCAQASDTGQLAYPVVVSRPGTNNTAAGYWIFYLNDSLHGSAPIYIKIEPGRGGSVTTPNMWITIGTSTDGAGTITGTLSSRYSFSGSSNASATNRQSYACGVAGFQGLDWKQGAAGAGAGSWYLSRTVDSSGGATGAGCLLLVGGGGTSTGAAVSMEFSSGTVQESIGTLGVVSIVPGAITSLALPGGDVQAFLVFGAANRVFPVVGVCTCLSSDIAANNTFSVALVGITNRTYKTGAYNAYSSLSPAYPLTAGNCGIAMLWE